MNLLWCASEWWCWCFQGERREAMFMYLNQSITSWYHSIHRYLHMEDLGECSTRFMINAHASQIGAT
jgi:hypothetical protein